MASYEEIKTELESIAELVGKFSESLQPRVFEILVNGYLGDHADAYDQAAGKKVAAKKTASKKAPAKKTHKKTPKKAQGSLTLLKDLDLTGSESGPSFKDFVTEKSPTSNIQFNAVAVYYLDKIVDEEGIGLSHIYTCYKHVSRKTPKNYAAFRTSLNDTASDDWGYIDFGDPDNITCPLTGESFVEHDLPASKKSTS